MTDKQKRIENLKAIISNSKGKDVSKELASLLDLLHYENNDYVKSFELYLGFYKKYNYWSNPYNRDTCFYFMIWEYYKQLIEKFGKSADLCKGCKNLSFVDFFPHNMHSPLCVLENKLFVEYYSSFSHEVIDEEKDKYKAISYKYFSAGFRNTCFT